VGRILKSSRWKGNCYLLNREEPLLLNVGSR
jgi:hypothetical protein